LSIDADRLFKAWVFMDTDVTVAVLAGVDLNRSERMFVVLYKAFREFVDFVARNWITIVIRTTRRRIPVVGVGIRTEGQYQQKT